MAVYAKHRVILTAVGVYSVNTKDNEIKAIENRVREIVLSNEYVLQMHGFYLTKDTKEIRFDAVVSFDSPDRRATYKELMSAVSQAFPDYTVQIAMDIDFS